MLKTLLKITFSLAVLLVLVIIVAFAAIDTDKYASKIAASVEQHLALSGISLKISDPAFGLLTYKSSKILAYLPDSGIPIELTNVVFGIKPIASLLSLSPHLTLDAAAYQGKIDGEVEVKIQERFVNTNLIAQGIKLEAHPHLALFNLSGKLDLELKEMTLHQSFIKNGTMTLSINELNKPGQKIDLRVFGLPGRADLPAIEKGSLKLISKTDDYKTAIKKCSINSSLGETECSGELIVSKSERGSGSVTFKTVFSRIGEQELATYLPMIPRMYKKGSNNYTFTLALLNGRARIKP